LARPWLAKHGVTYLGTGRRQPVRAAAAVLKRVPLAGQQAPYQADWDDLVAAAAAAGDRRVVVSSERFCNADDKVARQIVQELGGGHAHVVVTLRPLTRIVPSQWQQYVQDGLCVPYQEWLDGMFRRPPYEKPTPSFWRRHRHDQLVARWAAAVGPENLTVIVVDQSDPRLILRTFESLTGLPESSLTPKDDVQNRSLTLGEAELVRFLNAEFQNLGWSDAAYDRFVRRGAVRQMKTSTRRAEAHHAEMGARPGRRDRRPGRRHDLLAGRTHRRGHLLPGRDAGRSGGRLDGHPRPPAPRRRAGHPRYDQRAHPSRRRREAARGRGAVAARRAYPGAGQYGAGPEPGAPARQAPRHPATPAPPGRRRRPLTGDPTPRYGWRRRREPAAI
jgi:hypothetical protein